MRRHLDSRSVRQRETGVASEGSGRGDHRPGVIPGSVGSSNYSLAPWRRPSLGSGQQTGALRSAGLGDLPVRILPHP